MKHTAASVSQQDMQSCIDACMQCHRICWETEMNRCLETGGEHVKPGQYRLMTRCAIFRTA